jgi:hypothetical protein
MKTQRHTTGAQTRISRYWLDMLEENNVKFMALDPEHDATFIEQLQTRSDWLVESATEEAILFVRESAPFSK